MFDGIANFRDLGGTRLRGGGALRPGALLRSASLGKATDGDLDKLAGQRISVLLDLRRANERADDPNRLPPGFGARIVENADPVQGEAPHIAVLRQAAEDEGAVHAMALDFYRAMVVDPHLNAALRNAVTALHDEGDGALFIHCSAGKDRTGVAVALLLEALGVEEDDIMADYLASTALIQEDRLGALAAGLERTVGKPVPIATIRRMFGVEADWLHAFRMEVDARHGSRVAYLETFGLDRGGVDRLRARLCG